MVREIKELEQKVHKNKKDFESRTRLLAGLTKLQNLEDGPLAYIDVTSPEEIEKNYNVNVRSYFAKLDGKDLEIKDYSNPNNYAFLPSNLKMIVIGRTSKNREIAMLIIKQMITAISK